MRRSCGSIWAGGLHIRRDGLAYVRGMQHSNRSVSAGATMSKIQLQRQAHVTAFCSWAMAFATSGTPIRLHILFEFPECRPRPPTGALCFPCLTAVQCCPFDCWTLPWLADEPRSFRTWRFGSDDRYYLPTRGACRWHPSCSAAHALGTFLPVTPLACVPEFGKLSHLSGRSPERVIHYEAMRETGSDELMELVDTSATHIGHSVRFVYCTRPQHIQLPIRHAMREVRVLPIPGIVFACTVGPDASRCMHALACH